MTINTRIRLMFDVSQNEFKAIIEALQNHNKTAKLLAEDLEHQRAKQFEDIVRRFSSHLEITANEGTADVTRKGGSNE